MLKIRINLFYNFLRSLFFSKKFLKFVVVGGMSTIINYILFYLLFSNNLINYLAASAFGYVLGVFVGYFFNKYWTFQYLSKNHSKDLILYNLVYLTSMILGLLFLNFQVEFLIFNPLFANLVTIAFTTVSNFVGIKFLVFNIVDE